MLVWEKMAEKDGTRPVIANLVSNVNNQIAFNIINTISELIGID